MHDAEPLSPSLVIMVPADRPRTLKSYEIYLAERLPRLLKLPLPEENHQFSPLVRVFPDRLDFTIHGAAYDFFMRSTM